MVRAGTHPDRKWQVIYGIIHSAIENKGAVDDVLLDAFYGLGFSQAALMDLFVLINVMSFTNYVFRLTQIPIDFPAAKTI